MIGGVLLGESARGKHTHYSAMNYNSVMCLHHARPPFLIWRMIATISGIPQITIVSTAIIWIVCPQVLANVEHITHVPHIIMWIMKVSKSNFIKTPPIFEYTK